ncbi:MAG: hypothetical protein ACXWCX_11655 [Burkholderiales bacterium]
MEYEPIGEVSMTDADAALVRDSADELSRVVIAVALYSEDLAWAQNFCIRLARHAHNNVRGNAILGFGHLARRFGSLDRARVQTHIEHALSDNDKWVRGQAEAAAGDVEHFLRWKLAR